MAKRNVIVVVWVLLSAILAVEVVAQDAQTPEPQMVKVTAADGLTLVGDYYALPSEVVPEAGAPAVLLMHDVVTDRSDWERLADALVAAHYQVLAVDLNVRLLKSDAVAELDDVPVWLEWLKAQPGVRADRIIIGGAGLGAHLALNVCASDPSCVMVFALSPGCVGRTDPSCPEVISHEPGLGELVDMTANAVSENLSNRPMLLMAKQGSDYAEDSVELLTTLAKGDVTLRLYGQGSRSLSGLFQNDSLKMFVVDWIQDHMPMDKS